jgi:hypothetical protein
MRFKNFSERDIEYEVKNKVWMHPQYPDSFIQICERSFIEPGEVTIDFDPDDPVVQLMLKAHPELRPIVVPSVWERLRKPEI